MALLTPVSGRIADVPTTNVPARKSRRDCLSDVIACSVEVPTHRRAQLVYHMLEKNESVVLVSETDEPIGAALKLDAHRNGQLHRAFSVFITDDNGRILLHRRADGKYHSSGLWTNACCGHPRPGEDTGDAARRRLKEELGIECELNEVAVFTYRSDVGNGLTEHEVDHVFRGTYTADPSPDAREVEEWRWISPADLNEWIARDPAAFTVWFERALRASGVGTIRSSTFADERTPGTPPPG